MKKIFSKVLLICFSLTIFSQTLSPIIASATEHGYFKDSYVFDKSKDGYPVFRIPGLVVTNNDSLIAYCEARSTTSDWADMDIVMKRSTDGGETWSELTVLADGVSIGKTVNNPIMIAEKDSSTIHFIYCVEYEQAFYRKSTDDGLTWSDPREITSSFETCKDVYDWKVIATGPGHGIQLENGRLLVPIWLALNKSHSPSVTSTLYSDDFGDTWHMGEIIYAQGDMPNPNETSAVELTNGDVLLNIRNTSGVKKRAISISPNGDSNWSKPFIHEDLDDPTCFGSVTRLTRDDEYYTNRILSSNVNNVGGRNNLVVKMSMDEGQTWSYTKTIKRANIAYSDISVSNNKEDIYVLYEPNNGHPTLNFAKFNLEWLTDGEQTLDKRINPPSQVQAPTTSLMLNENWNDKDISWIYEGTETANVSDGMFNMASKIGSSNTLMSNYDLNIQSSYTLEFKVKVDDFYEGTTGDYVNFGTKVHDGLYRLMLDIKKDGIYAMTNSGKWEKVAAVDIDNNWHTYKAIVNNGSVEFFIDDSKVADFRLQEKKSNDFMQHWTRAKSNDPSNVYEDYIKIINNPETIDLKLVRTPEMSATATSEETTSENNSASCVIDGLDNTFWHTDWKNPSLPQSLTVDLGKEYSLDNIGMLPRQVGSANGLITQYELYLADESNNFSKVTQGTWSYGTNYSDRSEKTLTFEKQNVRYIKLNVLAGVGNFAALSEVKIYRDTTNLVSSQEINLETTIGTAPVLPKQIPTTLESGENINLPVMWDEFETEKFLNEGVVTMNGLINGTNLKATANITIKPALLIPENLSFSINKNDIKSIPTSIDITSTSGEINNYAVTWTNFDEKLIQNPGEYSLIGKLNNINLKIFATLYVNDTDEELPILPPEKITNLTATDITSNSLSLTWDKSQNSNENTEYIIYKDGKKIDSISNSQNPIYTIENLKSNTLYSFKIVTTNKSGEMSKPYSLSIRTAK